jgi:hypothetical protein
VIKDKSDYKPELINIFGETSPPADLCFICDPNEESKPLRRSKYEEDPFTGEFQCTVVCPNAKIAEEMSKVLTDEDLCKKAMIFPYKETGKEGCIIVFKVASNMIIKVENRLEEMFIEVDYKVYVDQVIDTAEESESSSELPTGEFPSDLESAKH